MSAASTPSQEGEQHDRNSIELPQVQEDLVQALYKTGKPMVMVNCSGSDVAFPWEAEHLPAILQAWYPGESGGRAVGEILFGNVNPSGHLTVTFYRATTDLPDFTNYAMTNRTYRYYEGKPLYAFGHGLSYTKFDFQGGKLGVGKDRRQRHGQSVVHAGKLRQSGRRRGGAGVFPPREFGGSAAETRPVRFCPRAV